MPIRNPAFSLLLTLLAACGGGGGGRSDSTFTSFDRVAAGGTAVIRGDHFLDSGTRTAGTTTVTSFDTSGFHAAIDRAQISLSYDANRSLEAATISALGASPAQDTSISFNRSSDAFNCLGGVCTLQNASAFAIVIDPVQGALGWNYQTFGVWNQFTGPTTFRTGAVTVGNFTPASAIPTTGSATFNGIARGFYVDATGASFSTAADMAAVANFSTRSIALSTSSTRLVDLSTGVPSAGVGLDISGTLNYGASPNTARPTQFFGFVNTTSGMSGSSVANLYGPNAEEIGGTYWLRDSTSVRRMMGAFGGRR